MSKQQPIAHTTLDNLMLKVYANTLTLKDQRSLLRALHQLKQMRFDAHQNAINLGPVGHEPEDRNETR